MDFDYDEDLLAIKDLCHDFIEKRVKPLVSERDSNSEARVPREVMREMGDLGLLGLTIPEEYGGAALGYKAICVAIEESVRTARAGIVCNLYSGANGAYSAPIMHFGTPEQQAKYMPGIVAGEIEGAMAITEPSGSSALVDLHTKARPEGDNYIVSGQKIFITRADTAAFIITIASSPEGPVALIVPTDTPGLTIGKSEEKMGLHGMGLNPVYYDSCVVPKANLLGKPGQGLLIAKDSLYDARLYAATSALGCAQAAIELAIEYAKGRILNGKALSSFQNTQFVLADAQTKVDAARLLIMRCADALDKGKHEYYMSSMAKYFAGEMCCQVVDKCLQVFGGYGYCHDYDIERLYRDVRVYRILDGASEIHQRLISKWMGVR
ncbi:MAG: acyl-CoA dehydrogenase family protein [Firmicutes bacterium]|nr:acyl-CoA dehydrogenase family protein [Bacillota bacterium]